MRSSVAPLRGVRDARGAGGRTLDALPFARVSASRLRVAGPLPVAIVVAVIGAAAYGLTLPDYGLTSDEGNYFQSSRRLFGWADLLLQGVRAGDPARAFRDPVLDESWRWGGDRIPHPPLSRVLAGVSGAVLYGRTDPLVAYRALGVLVAAGLAGLVAGWATQRCGAAGGLAGGAAFLLMPRLFAHAHFAGTDVLLSALVAASLAWTVETRRAPVAGAGVLAGLALATKFSAVLLLPVVVLWTALFRRERLRRLPLFFATAALAFAAVNPVVWVDPAGSIAEYLRQGVDRRDIAMAQLPTLYFGRLYTYRPPWHYAPVMLALTTPVTLLVFAAAGAASGLRDPGRRPAVAAALLTVAAFFGALALPSAPLHDDVRLFLPVLPLLALLAGFGCAAVMRASRGARGRRAPFARGAAAVLLLLAVGEPLLAHARLHPYQASYFNVLVGGLPGAAARGLEVTTMKEVLNRDAFHDINVLVPRGAALDGGGFLFEDLLFARDVAGWLRADVRLVPPPPTGALLAPPHSSDYLLLVNRGGWLRESDRALLRFGRPAYSVRVEDVPLLALYRLR